MRINKVIKYLVLSDLFFWTGWGLLSPVFAIFIIQRIQGGTAFVAGAAAGVYWMLKAALRIPMGLFLDKLPSEKDDYFFLVFGLFIASLTPFAFIFAKYPWHIYLIQVFQAMGVSMSLSGWQAIFTRHIDKGREATEWGIDATAFSFGTGIAGFVGGWAVIKFGFTPVFIGVGILGLLGALILLGLRNEIGGVFDHGFHFSLKDIFKRK